jgi:hypothetical protein
VKIWSHFYYPVADHSYFCYWVRVSIVWPLTCQMVKGIWDPRSLPDPRPPTEVWKDRNRRIGNLRRVSDANCKTNTTIYVNICSLISSHCTCRAVQGHTRRSQRGVVLPPKGLRSDRERERRSVRCFCNCSTVFCNRKSDVFYASYGVIISLCGVIIPDIYGN